MGKFPEIKRMEFQAPLPQKQSFSAETIPNHTCLNYAAGPYPK
jgi:hypothetical protein